MTTLQVSIPDELLELLGSREAASEHLRRAAVLELVKRQTISQGKGAELLGVSLWEFRDIMAEADVPVVDLSADELDEGHRNLGEALSGGDE
jgi:predicted HTH domain antitoxin